MTTTTLADLRRQNIKEMSSEAPSSLSVDRPSNEEMKTSSNDVMSARANEGTKARTVKRTGARASTGTRPRSGAQAEVPTSAQTPEDWLVDVLTQAKGADTGADKTTLSRLNVDIDDGLHLRLKTHCLKNRITLRKLVPVLLQAYLEKAGE